MQTDTNSPLSPKSIGFVKYRTPYHGRLQFIQNEFQLPTQSSHW